MTLRIPESVKTRAEDLATAAGQSLNSWIVNAVRAATADRTYDVDLRTGSGFADVRIGRRMTGWV